MRVFRKFRASDGRIKIATLSGVSALVAVIAMLVGVLPVFAAAPGPTGDEGVEPVQVDWGGGSGACSDDLISLEGDDEGNPRGPSAARYELHINNPVPGTTTYTGPDPHETQITVTVDENDEFFSFSIEGGMVAYDVVVNGGKKSNHYEYDGVSKVVPSDSHLSAPTKQNKEEEVHKLSHVNICYDMQQVDFVCDAEEPTSALHFGDGSFDGATATILTNSQNECTDKSGFFFIDGDETTLDFGDDTGTVAGRADYTKSFDSPTDPTKNFEDLEYDGPGEFVDLQWCAIGTKDATAGDGDQFDDVLASDEYPSLVGVTDTLDDSGTKDATACKVAEIENAAGTQVTVVYFEFEDPNFR